MNYTDPPPNNAGIGDARDIDAWSKATGTPKKKTLTYDKLVVEYDYEYGLLTVSETTDSPAKSMQFNKTELAELRNALAAFGLSSQGNGIQYR